MCIPMTPSKMTGFFKNEDCPSSNDLLEFQRAGHHRHRGSLISKHLAACEFCSAEVEFYSHYPQEESADPFEKVEIPAPLFQLAEALLKNRHSDSTSLESLLKEKGGILLDTV